MLLLAGILIVTSSSAASFRATVDRNSVTIGESVNLSLTFLDGRPDEQPALPEIPDVQQAGISASQSFSTVNGKTTAEVTYTFNLIPTKPGEVTIPALTIPVGGKPLSSQPIKLTVTPAVPMKETSENGQPSEAFLKLVLSKTNLVFGEIVPAEIRLYVQAAKNLTLPQLSAEGFSVSAMPQRPEQTQTQINGVGYNLAIFRISVTPIRTGQLTLGPATCGLTILSEPRRDFFGGTSFLRSRQATLTTDPIIVQVDPLPDANKPPTFAGAIGRFSMNVTASPTDVAVGDPITVQIQISGQGALDNLTLPPQPAWREFKLYTPNSKVETTDPLGLEGTKTFDLVVSPQNAGIKELPPFQFSYFDAEEKAYKTLTAPAVPLTVRATAATPQPTVVSASTSQNQSPQGTKEIVHIKTGIGTLKQKETPLISQTWFLGLQGIPPLLWIGAVIYRRRSDALANNPRLRRQKAVEQTIQTGIGQLKSQAAANKSDEFFANVFRLLQEQIGERLDVPASGITEAVLDNELKPRGLSIDALAQAQQLFDLCNQARYAPVRGSQQLAALIPKVEHVLTEIRKLNHEKVPSV